MDSIKEYEETLPGSNVRVHSVDGLDLQQIFDEIDMVFPVILAFSQS